MKTLRAFFIVAALWVAWLTREPHYVQLLRRSARLHAWEALQVLLACASRAVFSGRVQAKRHEPQARAQNLGGAMTAKSLDIEELSRLSGVTIVNVQREPSTDDYAYKLSCGCELCIAGSWVRNSSAEQIAKGIREARDLVCRSKTNG